MFGDDSPLVIDGLEMRNIYFVVFAVHGSTATAVMTWALWDLFKTITVDHFTFVRGFI